MSDLELVIIVCLGDNKSLINLELIALELKLNDQIIGKKMINIITEGKIKETPILTVVPIKVVRYDFSNQLTVIVNLPNTFEPNTGEIEYDKKLKIAMNKRESDTLDINLKIFGNGKIIITGCLLQAEAVAAIKIFQNAIKDLERIYKVKDISIENMFTVPTYLKYVTKNYIRLYKLFDIFDTSIDLHITSIFNKKYTKDITNVHELFTGNSDLFAKIIQCDKICTPYYPNYLKNLDYKKDLMIEALVTLKDTIGGKRLMDMLTRLFAGESMVLPYSYDANEMIQHVDIVNHNTKYMYGYTIDRSIATTLLNTEYRQQLYGPVEFTPENYQGAKIKYPVDNSSPVTIILFRESLMINGVSQWCHLKQAYDFICLFLEKESDKIRITQTVSSICTKKTPNKFKIGESFYIKKSIIMNNPRNCLLIKKHNLWNTIQLNPPQSTDH